MEGLPTIGFSSTHTGKKLKGSGVIVPKLDDELEQIKRGRGSRDEGEVVKKKG